MKNIKTLRLALYLPKSVTGGKLVHQGLQQASTLLAELDACHSGSARLCARHNLQTLQSVSRAERAEGELAEIEQGHQDQP